MAETKEKVKQGNFTLELPKNGEGPEVWTIYLKKLPEDIYVASMRLFRKEKDMDAIRFLLKNLYVGGDNINDVCNDWEAIFASIEQIMSLLPQAQGRLKKN